MYGSEDNLKPSVSTLENIIAALREENDRLRKEIKKLKGAVDDLDKMTARRRNTEYPTHGTTEGW